MKHLDKRIEKLEEKEKWKEGQEKHKNHDLNYFYKQVNNPESEVNKIFYQ